MLFCIVCLQSDRHYASWTRLSVFVLEILRYTLEDRFLNLLKTSFSIIMGALFEESPNVLLRLRAEARLQNLSSNAQRPIP